MSRIGWLGQQVWIGAMRRYIVASAVAHLVWEIVQLPLYTLWRTGTRGEQAFAVLHCTGGDLLIAGSALLMALIVVGDERWPDASKLQVAALTVAIGIAYTIYSEWLNTTVRLSWTYTELMPVVPWIGTGLSPLLQWIVVPALALWAASGRANEASAPAVSPGEQPPP
jgi:hypothetical protein